MPGGRDRLRSPAPACRGAGVRTGCAWRQLPKDFPPWPTVYWYFTWGMTTAPSSGSTTPCADRSAQPTAGTPSRARG
ncbi:transposase [Streptomyces fildesensis]|uniref:Transposase n=1 Tax=Streptomyces fildesensis TaxID=375757 RepID=A0ABW8CJ64_9ACTN